ncbi:MAG: serine hydrolase [Halioglobus sp.]|nr:serine hydrolase [Halioglobus sp.]
MNGGRKTVVAAVSVILLVALLLINPYKTIFLNGLMLEANAYINDLLKSQDSFLASMPSAIKGATQSNSAPISASNSTDSDLLNAWFEKSQTEALLVQKRGQIIYERYAQNADRGRNVNGMSMAKNIIALMIGIAIDEGEIQSENDSISLYLPEIATSTNARLTVRDLLRHTSGIQSTIKDLSATLKGKGLATPLAEISFNGDRAFHYDNINYHLLNLILVRIYEQPLNRLIEEKLWQPLRLEDAAIINTAGYCCLFATARSWLGIGNLYLNQNNPIVSSHWIEKMVDDTLTPQWFFVQATGESAGNSYGYHIYRGLPTSPETFWVEGMGLQLIMINRKTQTIIVRLGGIPSKFRVTSNRNDANLIEPLLRVLAR